MNPKIAVLFYESLDQYEDREKSQSKVFISYNEFTFFCAMSESRYHEEI